MTATLTAQKQTAMLTKFREAAAKEADDRLQRVQERTRHSVGRGVPVGVAIAGLTLGGIRRQIERGFMMQTISASSSRRTWTSSSLADIREYYTAHLERVSQRRPVKWQDLFVMNEQFKSVDEARQYATQLAAERPRAKTSSSS